MKFRNKFTIASTIAAASISLAAAAVLIWVVNTGFFPDFSEFQRFLLFSAIFYLNFLLFFFILPIASGDFRKKIFDINFPDFSESDGFFPFIKKYKNLINQLPVGIYRTTKEGRILEANKELAAIFGYDSVEEFKRHNVYEFFESESERNELVEKKLQKNTYIDETIPMKSKDGRKIWVRDLGRIIYDKKGQPAAIDGIIQDITARKNAEEELIRSEKRYSRLFENLHDIFFQFDPDGRILRISPSMEQVTGFTRDEAVGMNVRDILIHGSDIDNFFKILNKKGKVNSFLVNIRGKQGNRIHLSINARFFENKEMNIRGIEGIATNVTDEIRSKNILNTLFNISRALDSCESINELYSA